VRVEEVLGVDGRTTGMAERGDREGVGGRVGGEKETEEC
jgi:hypothetical protein